jgi:exodeoxyribonuclease VII small subunit
MKSFEERLSRLESLSEKIKEGDLPLEEAVSLFEEGIGLARGLENELSRIERKVEILVNKPGDPADEPKTELFPELFDQDREGSGEPTA